MGAKAQGLLHTAIVMPALALALMSCGLATIRPTAIPAVTATPSPLATASRPTTQPPRGSVDIAELEGSIAFMSSTATAMEIWVLTFNGTPSPVATQITAASKPGQWSVSPSWAADGSHICFERALGDDVGVYVMNADGSNQIRIADDAGAPAWSPIGNEIAVSNLARGQRGLALVDLDDPTHAPRQITIVADAVPEEYPDWAPDGQTLAFNSHRSGVSEVWTVERDGTNLRQVTDDPNLDLSPDWSPGGSRLAFTSQRSGEGDIYLVDPDGSNLSRLTSGPYFEGGPSWSPDGEYIVYSARNVPQSETGNLALWVMRSDGTGATLLFDSEGEDAMVDWTATTLPSADN